MAKDAYYFSHDSNARNDLKILALRASRNGLAKYAIYWMLIETLRETDGHELRTDYKTLSWDFHCSPNLIESVVSEYDLFKFSENLDHFYSTRLKRSMSQINEKSMKASQSAHVKWDNERKANLLVSERIANAELTQSERNAIKVKEIKLKESKGKEIKVNVTEEINLLFNFLNFDESKLNDSIISRTQKLIDQYSFSEVKAAFEKASTLDEKKKNIAYIEAMLNSPKSTAKQNTDIAFSYYRELD